MRTETFAVQIKMFSAKSINTNSLFRPLVFALSTWRGVSGPVVGIEASDTPHASQAEFREIV